MGPYIVDFFCPEALLVIEVDGGQHDSNAESDSIRTGWLADRSYRVLRFWNNEVLASIDGVLVVIREALAR